MGMGPLEYGECVAEGVGEVEDMARVMTMWGLDEDDGGSGEGVGDHGLVMFEGRGGDALTGHGHEDREGILKPGHGRSRRRVWWRSY